MQSLWDALGRDPELLIPMIGLVVAGAIAIAFMIMRHRERMALIEHGIDPNRAETWDGETTAPAARDQGRAEVGPPKP